VTNASLPFVHTARRCYRLGFAVTRSETVVYSLLREAVAAVEVLITARPRGSRSRNKVIVGEPAFGSLLTVGLHGPLATLKLPGSLDRKTSGDNEMWGGRPPFLSVYGQKKQKKNKQSALVNLRVDVLAGVL
jgi:hypothetical protein